MASVMETPVTSPAVPVRRDFRQEVTDSIIKMLENGAQRRGKSPREPGALGLPITR